MEQIPYYFKTMTVKAPLCIDGCTGIQATPMIILGYLAFVLTHLVVLAILLYYISTRR